MLLALLACAARMPPGESAPEQPLLLWRVERAGAVSHLLGTCHIGVPLDYALPAPHHKALEGARVVYTEARLDGDLGEVVAQLWDDGPGLSTRLSPDEWRAVATVARDMLPAPLLEHTHPWVLAMTLPMAGGGASATDAMDLAVQRRGKAHGAELVYLETLAEQAALLSAHDDHFLEQLRAGGAEGSDAADDALTALCFRGDISNTSLFVDPTDPMTEPLLLARNRAWVPKLAEDLATGGAFVAVGAAHLLGDGGLLALLGAEGYTATRLTTTRPASDDEMPSSSARVPPAPPAPPGLEARVDAISAPIAAEQCADGSLTRACFEPDAERCVTRITADAGLCVRQHADLLPTDGGRVAGGIRAKIETCATTGVLFDALAHDRIGSAPLCGALKGALSGVRP